MTGWSKGTGTGEDIVTVRYDDKGQKCWDRRFDGPAHGQDRPEAIAVDPSGKVYVAGWAEGSTGNSDFVVLKYDSNGRCIWKRFYNGIADGKDQGRGIALGNNADIYITGASRGDSGSLDYATVKYTQPKWEISPFSTTGIGASIAIDSSGRPHVCYLDEPEPYARILRYAYFDGTNWHKKIIDSEYTYYPYSITLDSLDRPHISYCASDKLKYAHFNGVTWRISTVDNGYYSSNSIATDRQNRPHISSTNQTRLRYARHDGTRWIKETVLTGVVGNGGTSPALTDSGKAHITFTGNDDGVYWATNSSGSWEMNKIGMGVDSAIARDTSGNLHVVYLDRPDEIKYARFNGSQWVTTSLMEALGLFFGYGNDPRITVDRSGVPHVLFEFRQPFHRPGGGDFLDHLIYARAEKQGWRHDLVGEGYRGSLDVRGNSVHVVYPDRTQDDISILKYVRMPME